MISIPCVHKLRVFACTPAALYAASVGAWYEQKSLSLQLLATILVRFPSVWMSRHPIRALVTLIGPVPGANTCWCGSGGGLQASCAGGFFQASPWTITV